jgi:hypothetical protein
MAAPFTEWTVLPHRPIAKLNDRVWHVEGKLGNIRRCMTVVKLADGRLVIHNAVALEEPSMKELEAFGKPAFLLVPNGFHRMDARIWKKRYPELTVVSPPAAEKKVSEIVKVDTTNVDFGDPTVRYQPVPGTNGRECALEVRGAQGMTVVVNDIIFNQRPRPGLGGMFFRMIGFTAPTPNVPGPSKLMLVKDKRAFRAYLEELAANPDLKHLVVAHGDVITDPATGLRQAASTV